MLNKKKIIFAFLFFLNACIPAPLSSVRRTDYTYMGFKNEKADIPLSGTKFEISEPGILLKPVVTLTTRDKTNIAASMEVLENDEAHVYIYSYDAEYSCREGVFPPLLPLFPYMDCSISNQTRWEDKARVTLCLIKKEKTLQHHYHFRELYLQDGEHKIYPQQNLDLKIGRDEACQTMEFPLPYREMQGKELRLDYISVDGACLNPVAAKLEFNSGTTNIRTFFHGLICINC